MCAERNIVSQAAGWGTDVHEHVNTHILLSLLWGYVHIVTCEKI